MRSGAAANVRVKSRYPGIICKLTRILCLAVLLTGTIGDLPALGSEDRLALVAASSNNFPPINLLDEEDNLTGFGRDLAKAVVKAAGGEVTHIHSPIWGDVLGWLESGRADFIHDTGYTPERTVFLDFSEPILEMAEGIFVLDHRYDIQSLQSLHGKRVACVNKHITHLYLQKIPEINCHIVRTPAEGIQALLNETVDAFIYPRQIVLYYAYRLDTAGKIKEVGEPLRTLTWHLTVKKGNNRILVLLNQGIAKVRGSGEYDRIYDKWFGRIVGYGYTTRQVTRIVGIVALVAGLLIGAITIWSWSLRRLVGLRTAELSESEASLANAQRIARLGNWQCDLPDRKMLCSREAFRILGVDSETFSGTGTSFFALILPEDRELVESTISSCAETGAPAECEYRIETGAGQIKFLFLRAEFEAGPPLRIRGTIQDITERKRIENEIHELNEKLETRIEERTRELEEIHKQLIKQERMATLGELTGVVAHELRNPLGTILSYMEVIRLKAAAVPGGELAEVSERIVRNIDRCDMIIASLLDYSRVAPMEKRATALDDWLARVLAEIGVTEDIPLNTEFGAAGLSIEIDRNQLRRVLVNLIDNASQAMQAEAAAGSEKTHAITVATRAGDGVVYIEISDNGPGMPPDIQSRVFDPLFSTKAFGVGLGLSIAQRIVEQHDGQMSLNSQPSEGTSVSIAFPLGSQVKNRSAA